MKATESPKLAKSKRGESQGLDDEETRTTASHADKVKPLRDPTSKTNDTETSKRKKRKKIDDEDGKFEPLPYSILVAQFMAFLGPILYFRSIFNRGR
jgi:hypothetical protein